MDTKGHRSHDKRYLFIVKSCHAETCGGAYIRKYKWLGNVGQAGFQGRLIS